MMRSIFSPPCWYCCACGFPLLPLIYLLFGRQNIPYHKCTICVLYNMYFVLHTPARRHFIGWRIWVKMQIGRIADKFLEEKSKGKRPKYNIVVVATAQEHWTSYVVFSDLHKSSGQKKHDWTKNECGAVCLGLSEQDSIRPECVNEKKATFASSMHTLMLV